MIRTKHVRVHIFHHWVSLARTSGSNHKPYGAAGNDRIKGEDLQLYCALSPVRLHLIQVCFPTLSQCVVFQPLRRFQPLCQPLSCLKRSDACTKLATLLIQEGNVIFLSYNSPLTEKLAHVKLCRNSKNWYAILNNYPSQKHNQALGGLCMHQVGAVVVSLQGWAFNGRFFCRIDTYTVLWYKE